MNDRLMSCAVERDLARYEARIDAGERKQEAIDSRAAAMVAEMQDDDDLLNEAIGAALEKEPRPGIDNLAPLLREAAKNSQPLAAWLDAATNEYAMARAEGMEGNRNAA